MREVEVKLIGLNEDQLVEKILQKGGRFDCEEKQVNIRINSSTHPIDDPAYLRIRRIEVEGKETVREFTFKERKPLEGARVNEEYTCRIDDEEALLEILARMGYDRRESAWKVRRRYLYRNYRIEFDRWDAKTLSYPYIELEGESPEALDRFFREFSIPQEAISTRSIAELRAEEQARSS